MAETWQPGEGGAQKTLRRFLDDAMARYDTGRDIPSIPGVSRMSPYLAFGEISPHQILDAVRKRLQGLPEGSGTSKSGWGYIRQLGWREFSYHLLYHFPHTPTQPLKTDFNAFPWREDPAALHAWQQGRTGYPIVDAGMRELWATGWMHNRVRMLVASFLAKDLLIPWQAGAAWFWDTLVDADLANNTMGWQWTAGSGADASPYFRIFNPILQGEKFDPQGHYVRRWVPELKTLPDKWIHRPWEAPLLILAQAGITPGETYPHPLVDHFEAKERALSALKSLRNTQTQ
jgi:deoxyribodipyrimidine photo-lyase